MERLSLIDQLVHKVGYAGLPALNMQGAMVIDPAKAAFEINAMVIAEHIAARLVGFPILRQKLVQDPLKIGDLRLIDDPDFDVWNHITFDRLPSPGDQRTLNRHLARFSAEELDPDRPLWRFEIIEGLEDGKIALVQKLSHATMDGMTAMKVMQYLFDMEAKEPSKLEPSDWQPEPAPGKMSLLMGAVKENAQRFGVKAPKTMMSLTKSLAKSSAKSVARKILGEEDDDSEKGGQSNLKAPPTSINQGISRDKRSITYATYQVSELKRISKALGCKINDLCLLMSSEALKEYFEGIDEKIDFDLVLVMPIDMRGVKEMQRRNGMTLSMVNVHNTIESLPERLKAIHNNTTLAKSVKSPVTDAGIPEQDIMGMFSPLVVDMAMALLNRIQKWEKLPSPVHAVMTNVPGPPGTLYFAGMPIEYQIPIIPVFHKAALAIGASSMGNNLSIGFHGCGRVVKEENLHFLTDGLQRAYKALEKMAAAAARQAASAEVKSNQEATKPAKAKPETKKPVSPKATTAKQAKAKPAAGSQSSASNKPAASGAKKTAVKKPAPRPKPAATLNKQQASKSSGARSAKPKGRVTASKTATATDNKN